MDCGGGGLFTIGSRHFCDLGLGDLSILGVHSYRFLLCEKGNDKKKLFIKTRAVDYFIIVEFWFSCWVQKPAPVTL